MYRYLEIMNVNLNDMDKIEFLCCYIRSFNVYKLRFFFKYCIINCCCNIFEESYYLIFFNYRVIFF